MSSNIRLTKTCVQCGKEFIAKTTVTACCGNDCARDYYKRRKREEKIQLAIQKENEMKPFNPVVKEKEFLSIDETCQLLGASRWTIYRLIERKKIKAAKLGSRTIIKREIIDNLFK
ncbi:MAG: helix-turn-helix domain-containing protein [Chitinophagales bacterium]|nr:helix-turn-helix domain-containing protein [Chitinophagales bacterium]